MDLLRNMLVREYKEDLYLLSAVSPEWFQPARRIEVTDQPTSFGPISFTSRAGSSFDDWNWVVSLSSKFRTTPKRLLVRVPWFYQVRRAEIDGRLAEVKDGHIALPTDARELRVRGAIRHGTPEISFDRTVDEYKREYRTRYQEFLRTGVTKP